MNESARQKIVRVVGHSTHPAVSELLREDAPEFDATLGLVQVLVPTMTVNKRLATRVVDFTTPSGQVLLSLQMQGTEWTVSGELSNSVSRLLSAIRVHEVDSYEWVYLPPDLRKKLVEDRATSVGASATEFRTLMNLWTTR
jgi:hypothetical protein